MAITADFWYYLGGTASDLQGKWLVHGSASAMCLVDSMSRFNEGFFSSHIAKKCLCDRMCMTLFIIIIILGELNFRVR